MKNNFQKNHSEKNHSEKTSSSKIHRHLLQETLRAVEEIFSEKYYADKVIERYLKLYRKWGARDRRFFAENVYEMVRWYRKLLVLAKQIIGDDSLWSMWVVLRLLQRLEIPDLPEFEGLKIESNVFELQKKLPRAVRESVPDWLDQVCEKELGEDVWNSLLSGLNKPAEVFLRVNSLKANLDQVILELQKDSIDAVKVAQLDSCLRLSVRKNVFISAAFRNGFFEVQDGASQQVAPLLQVEPGMRVVDACAGAGGKSLHLAAIMKNKGRIIAMDIHDKKLVELKNRSRRAGVDIIETRIIDSSKVIKRMEKTADRVLLDVPCTGLGTLRRNPDKKWKLKEEDLKNLVVLQEQLLSQYSIMCKEGGILVYATCSILPSENQHQVQNFLTEQKGQWELIKELYLRPDQDGFDGFYAASLRRKGPGQ